MQEYVLIDAKDKIFGRVCSQVAKKALLGQRVVIVNAKDSVISGNKDNIHKNYLDKLLIHTNTNPTRGPFWSRRPDTMMRASIRKMLPRKKSRGRDAIRRVHVYVGEIPERFKISYQKLVPGEIIDADKTRLSYYNKYITLGNLCLRVGWKRSYCEV